MMGIERDRNREVRKGDAEGAAGQVHRGRRNQIATRVNTALN